MALIKNTDGTVNLQKTAADFDKRLTAIETAAGGEAAIQAAVIAIQQKQAADEAELAAIQAEFASAAKTMEVAGEAGKGAGAAPTA